MVAMNEPTRGAMSDALAKAGPNSARTELAAGNWASALQYAELGLESDPRGAKPLVAEACFRLARQAVLAADFATANSYAERAIATMPNEHRYQRQLSLIRKATGKVVRERVSQLFPDATGSAAQLWSDELLAKVRGWDAQRASVPAATIMGEVRRKHLEDIYALGIYTPWHAGMPRLFAKYVRELKKHGQTVGLAAALLWQGLTCDHESGAPTWIEKIDVVVPMATSWRSYEVRGHEVTEELASELASRLCVPCVDAFERDPDASGTHLVSGYAARLEALMSEIRVKAGDVADLTAAQGVLIVDDIVTYGSTFEACAGKLRERHPRLRCWGAALAYTQTPARLARARAENAEF